MMQKGMTKCGDCEQHEYVLEEIAVIRCENTIW